MKYKKFIIKNYKAIKDLTINLNKNIIPLIGVNESGKTSILHAILAFDRAKDSLLEGKHCETENKYKTTQEACRLIACIEIDSEELEEIEKEAGVRVNEPVHDFLKAAVENSEEIYIVRNYDEKKECLLKKYTIINDEEKAISDNSKLINSIYKRLPNILYFDDFSDRVPKKVCFLTNYVNDLKLSRGKDREWQEIIEEIFNRAIEEDFSLKKFLELEDRHKRGNYINDATDTLNSEIIQEWINLKNAYSQFADDIDQLKLEIEYDESDNSFLFTVIDNEHKKRRRIFNIVDRSKGFQWFFNFIMKLKFNPKYETNPDNAIFLLDEPGSYLHSSAQTELLSKLRDIGEENTIIYCTHSQYLLDPDKININSIRIVSKDESQIKLVEYGQSKYSRNIGAFSPLNHALHLKFGFHERMLKRCMVVEGITEYYFYNMFFNFSKIHVLPGTGANQLEELISILISCSDQFLVVLDNDKEGKSAKKRYEKFFGQAFSDRFYQYENVSREKKFELEDILAENDKERIMKAVKCIEIKNAITSLFYEKEGIKKELIKGFDSQTKEAIKNIEKR